MVALNNKKNKHRHLYKIFNMLITNISDSFDPRFFSWSIRMCVRFESLKNV